MSNTELIRLRDLIQESRRHLVQAMRLTNGEAHSSADEADRLIYNALVRVQRAIEDRKTDDHRQWRTSIRPVFPIPLEDIDGR